MEVTMLNKRKFSETKEAKNVPRRSKTSWKSVSTGFQFYEQGEYGKALPLFFKYEDVDARAMFLLACMYSKGLGVIENMKTAASYMQKLVSYQDIHHDEECFLAMAYYYLGDLYFRGAVLAKDDMEAEKLWRQGAVMNKDKETDKYHYGTMKCQTALGLFYSDPQKKKVERAFYWHKKAAQSGSIISDGALGVMYMYGIATEENLQSAYNHLTNAAAMDNIYAKGYLAAFYYYRQMYSRTVSVGRELAVLEDYKALANMNDCSVDHVKQGIAVGCFYLALCTQYGYTVPKDVLQAKLLIKKALELCTDIACELHIKAIMGVE